MLSKFNKKMGHWSKFKNNVRDKTPYIVATVFLFLLVFLFLFQRIVIYVHPGERGVIYRPFSGGTMVDRVFEEGVHILNPVNTLEIYDIRINIIRHEFSVLTNRGLPVNLAIAVRYHPIEQYLGLLHQEVGPDYPNKIILTQIESVLRKGLGTHSPEEIYTNKDQLLSKLISFAIKEIGHNYIFVEDVIIRSVSLPDEVRKSIERKLVEEQTYLSYQFKIKAEMEEAKRKRIESAGIRDYAKNISETMGAKVLDWHGMQATLELAKSNNSKVIVIGGAGSNLPLIINTHGLSENENPLGKDLKNKKNNSSEINHPSDLR